MAADDDDSASPPKSCKAAPKVAASCVREERYAKLSVLSGVTTASKWSFGNATRFNWEKADKSPGRCSSSPALATNASLSTAAPEDAADEDMEVTDQVGGLRHCASTFSGFSSSSWAPNGGKMDASATMCRSFKAPRLDGSTDRSLIDGRNRAGVPKAKSYEPAQTMGHGMHISMAHSPQFSFGGGKSRMQPLEPPPDYAVPARLEKTWKPDQMEFKRRREVGRGFGSSSRMRYKGSCFELPPSPGPAAYEVPREIDPPPAWGSGWSPWGRRTGQRSAIVLPTATDAGPGEYTADHGFQAAGPTAKMGQRLNELRRDNFPAPHDYELPSTLDTKAAGLGFGSRSQFARSIAPGPGAYEPHMRGVDPHSAGAVFGTCARAHPADEVDPDEPPGPGAHEVRSLMDSKAGASSGPARNDRSIDFSTRGLPGESSGREVAGMGPKDVPGPGSYEPPGFGHAATVGHIASMGGRLAPPSVKCPVPGPGTYEPKDDLIRHSSGNRKPLQYKAPRRTGFGNEGSCTEKRSEAMLRRCAVEVAHDVSDDIVAKQHAAERVRNKGAGGFVPSGPSYSFGARRPDPVPYTGEHNMIGGVSSMG